jgi:hypothetical protein
MEAEIKPPMSKEEAAEVLEQVKKMLRIYADMFRDVLSLVTASAEMGLDTVDSKLLVQILSRHQESVRKL